MAKPVVLGKDIELMLVADELPGTNGFPVPSYTDISGHNRHLTGTAPNPAVLGAQAGGKKSVGWDGASNPLKYDEFLISVKCFWMVVKINAFTASNGVLSSPTDYPILAGAGTTNFFRNDGYENFEYRLNNRIYHQSAMPAPIGVYGIIFCKFAQNVVMDGIQLGQDRTNAASKLDGSIPFLLVSSFDYCEDDITAGIENLSVFYQIPIAPVFPFPDSKTDESAIGKKIVSDGSSEPNTRIIRGNRRAGSSTFADRSQNEFRAGESWWKTYHPSKTFVMRERLTPPRDTVVRIRPESEFQDKGWTRARKSYGFDWIESLYPVINAIPGQAAEIGTVLDTTRPTAPSVASVADVSGASPAIRITAGPSIAFGGRSVTKYFFKIDGIEYDNGNSTVFTLGVSAGAHDISVAAFDGSFKSLYSAIVTYTAVQTPANTTPVAPAIIANDDADTIQATHALGYTEILVSYNFGPFGPYPNMGGAINVTNVDRAAKFYRFKIKAATGRNESPVAESEAFFYAAPGNDPPVASNVRITDGAGATITGTIEVGQTVYGRYDYFDSEGDPESASPYRFVRGDSVLGANTATITGATGTTTALSPVPYTAQAADVNKYIGFIARPFASIGNGKGSEVPSLYYGKVVNFTPPAPTNAVVNDTLGIDTAAWTNAPGFVTGEHEISINAGASYNAVSGNPHTIGNIALADGSVMVRVKAAPGRNASAPLVFGEFRYTPGSGGESLVIFNDDAGLVFFNDDAGLEFFES